MQRIGRYEIKDKLGLGGFGQVFRALDPAVGRMVAIKVLTASGEPDMLTRFRNEATAAGKLRHHNIVTVYDFGEQDGVPYIVMELMDGEDLHHVITRRRPLTVLQKVRIMMETATGLNHAHRHGIVHRDVKPANIMLLADGSVKIMDFGIALLTQATGSRLTPQGSVIGTFRYMAPDQFYGMPSDALSDIFSFGVIFYELLTGRHPFHAAEPAALMHNIIHREPEPLRSLLPECPEALEPIVARLLHKDREQRYQNLEDMHYDLGPIVLALEREHTAELLSHARDLLAADEVEGAQTLVRKILDADPAHREARAMREEIQQRLHRKRVLPRIELLVKTGQSEVAARHYAEAVQNFESALRLDRTNAEVRELLEQARTFLERQHAVERLLTQAKAQLDRQEFEPARGSVAEALGLDPENPEAVELSENIAARERDRRVDEAVVKAKGFLESHSYDAAIGVLAELGDLAKTPKVKHLVGWIQAQKADSQRRHRLQTGMATATDLLRDHRYEEAVQFLADLRREFPDDREVASLYQYGQRELETQQRAQAVEKCASEADALAANKDFAAALQMLEDGLQKYPGERSLLRLRSSLRSAKTDWEREQAVLATLEQCAMLEAQKQFPEAIQTAEAALAAYPGETALRELVPRLEAAREQYLRSETIRQTSAAADREFEQGRPEQALPAIQQALAQYPGDAELMELLERAQRERAAAIELVARDAAQYLESQDFERAQSTIEQGLARFPAEPRLIRRLDALKAAQAAWQREQAINEVLHESAQHAREKRYSEAIQLLTHSLEQYRDEPVLRAAQHHIQHEWDDHKRREAVAHATTTGKALLERGKLPEAVELLQTALARFPDEAELGYLLAQARHELEERERAETIARVQRDARGMVGLGDYVGALQMVALGLQNLPENETLLALRESIQAEYAAWKHQQALREIAARAEQWAQQGRVQEALDLVHGTLEENPGESALAALEQRLQAAWEEQRRREAIQQSISDAQALLKEDRLEEASLSLSAALAQFPGEPALESLRAEAQRALDARSRRQQMGEQAEFLLAQGRLDESLRLLREGLSEFQGDAILSGLLARTESELKERERAEAAERALQEAITNAEGLWREDRVPQGLAYLESVLPDFPDAEPLLALRRQFRARQRMLEASALIDNGQPAEALQTLRDLASSEPSNPELKTLIERAEEAVRAQERAAEIRKACADAKQRAFSGDFDGALSVVEAALEKWPGERSLVEIRQQTVAEKQAWLRQRALQDAVRRGEELQNENRLGDALRQTEEALAEFAGETVLLRLREQIQAKLEEERRRQIRERDLADLRRLDRVAQEPEAEPRAAEMLELARTIVAHYPNDAEIRAAGSTAADHLGAIVRARRELANDNFAAARALCDEFLAKYPNHPIFSAMKTEAEQGEQVAYVSDLQNRTAAEVNLEARIQMLEEGLRRYPGELALQEELRFARNKLGLVTSIAEAAAAREAAGQWDQALEQWNSLTAIYKEYPGLEENLRRVQRKREELRAAAIAGWMQQIGERIEAGDVAKASALLTEAAALFPDAPGLQQLTERLETLRRQKAEARDLLASGQADCDNRRYREGGAALQRSYELDTDPRRQKLVMAAFLKYARAALESDWNAAEALLAQAATLDPQFTAPDDLVRGVQERKQKEAADKCLSTAEHMIRAGDPEAALRELESTATAFPGEPRLKRRRDALAAELKAKRDKLKAEIDSIGSKAEAGTDVARLEELLARTREITGLPEADAEVKAAAETTGAQISGHIRRLKTAQAWAAVAARKKQILAGAAAVVVALGAFFGIREFLRPVPLMALQVTSSPEHAAVKVGNQSCTSTPCEFQLKPGDHPLEVRLEGYQPVIQQVHIGTTRPQPLTISLQPLPASIQVSTNFASGRVSLDGKDRGELQNGQFTIADVPFGKHQLAISGRDGQAHVSFQTAAGKLPSISGPINAQGVDALAIANLGGSARLNSIRTGEPALLDGKSVGQTSQSGLALQNLAVGNRELKIGDRSFVMSVTDRPTLRVIANADRNVGSLVVDTGGEDSVTVTVDGKSYGRTAHGIFRLPLDARDKPYSVRVEKNGYRVSPAVMQATIKKDGEVRAAFHLEAIPPPPQLASLNITGAAPGTQVVLDEKSAGTTGTDGSFSTGIQPGVHQIELRRDGYVSKRFQRSFTAGNAVALGKSDAVLSPVPPTPAQLEARDWEQVRESNDLATLDEFLRKYPHGAHADEVRARETQLRQQAQAGAARRADQTAWDATDKGKKASLQDYLTRFGSGLHAQEARTLMAHIDKQEADALAAAQRAQQNSLEDAAILKAIAAFEAAYNHQDLKGLRSAWPTMPKSTGDSFRDQFRYTKSLTFQLRPAGQPVVNGDAATVNCTRTLDLTTKDGQHAGVSNERVRVTLGRGGSGWVINSITPY